MPYSKTPGGQQASAKFQKQQAQKEGLGADNAPGHTEGSAPGEKPVASDSGSTGVGVRAGQNTTGEKGINEPIVDSAPTSGSANMKS